MQIIMTAASVTIKTKGNWPFILSKSELPVICSKLPGFAEQYYAHFRIFHMYFYKEVFSVLNDVVRR